VEAVAIPFAQRLSCLGLKLAFSDPALRQKVSERTKAGMAAKLERQFAELVAVWEKMPKKVRGRFLDHVGSGAPCTSRLVDLPLSSGR
jgi:hypothetical protein